MENKDKVIITIDNSQHVTFEFEPQITPNDRSFRVQVASQILDLFKDDVQDSQDKGD